MLTWLCKKMSLPAHDLRYIITSKMLVHCTEHQYAFVYKTPVVIEPWRSTNANLHCMVPTMIFIPNCEFVYFYTIYKVSHNKEKRRASHNEHFDISCA